MLSRSTDLTLRRYGSRSMRYSFCIDDDRIIRSFVSIVLFLGLGSIRVSL
jgi:hypothetical protein